MRVIVRLAWLFVSLAVLLTFAQFSGAARAEALGHITGTVTDVDGFAVAGVEVRAYRWVAVYEGCCRVGDDLQVAASAETNDSGFYDLAGLPADDYRVYFEDPSGQHAFEFLGHTTSATDASFIRLTEGQSMSGQDTRLRAAGHITGRVSGVGGDAFAGIEVTLYARWVDHRDVSGNSEPFAAIVTVSTAASGSFAIDGLAAGIYKLAFRDPSDVLAHEFYDSAPNLLTSDGISVPAGETVSSTNVEMTVPGSISGTVTDESGAPLSAGVSVYAATDAGDFLPVAEGVGTDSPGGYEVSGLPAGDYRIFFQSPGFRDEYFDDALTVETATDITVDGGGTVSGKDAELALLGRITGTVRDVEGAGLAGIHVTGRKRSDFGDWAHARAAVTDASGSYALGSLDDGDYRLWFRDPTRTHAPEFFDNASSVEAATTITVLDGELVTGQDVELAPAGHITGTVSGPGGEPLSIMVTPFRWEPWGGGGWVQAEVWADSHVFTDGSTGRYVVSGLAAGEYRLCFNHYAQPVMDECFDNATTLETATSMFVGVGETLSGKDAQLSSALVAPTVAATPTIPAATLTPTPTVTPTPAALLALKVPRRQVGAPVKGTAQVGVSDSAVKAKLTFKPKTGKSVKVGSLARSRVPAGSLALRVALTKAGRALLKKAGKLALMLTVTGTPPVGPAVTITRPVTLKSR